MNNGAQALYEDDKRDDAVAQAERLLENDGIADALAEEEHLPTASKCSPVSSHQMLHVDRGMCG